uniref:Ubiquitin-like domain-containing protein n=1 Tax=Strongyloides papillosus TaxID=174720 RepID=A0A0N5BWX0_STREA
MIEISTEKLNFADFFSSYTFIIGIFLLILGIAYFHATWLTRNDHFNIDKIAWIVEEIFLPTRTIVRVFPLTERQMIIASTSNSSQYFTNILREDTTGINISIFQNDISNLRKHILVVYGPKTGDKDEKLLKNLRDVAGKKFFFSFHKDDSIYNISSGIAELTNFAFALLVTSAISKLRDNRPSHKSTIFSFPRVLKSCDLENDEIIYRHSIETKFLSESDLQKSYVKSFFSKRFLHQMISLYTEWIPDGPNREDLVRKYRELAIEKYCKYAIKTQFFVFKMQITELLIRRYPNVFDEEEGNSAALKLINNVTKNLLRCTLHNNSRKTLIYRIPDTIYKRCYKKKDNILGEAVTYTTFEDEDKIIFNDTNGLQNHEEACEIYLINSTNDVFNPQIMAIDNSIYGDFLKIRRFTSTHQDDDIEDSLFPGPVLQDTSSSLRLSRIARFYGFINESDNDLNYENNLYLEARRQLGFLNNQGILNFSGNIDNSSIHVEESSSESNQYEDIAIHFRDQRGSNTSDSDEEDNENNESNTPSEFSSEENNDEGNLNETIKLKFLNDEEKIVPFTNSMKVGEFKKIHFKDAVNQKKMIRLIFSGQLCRDDNKKLSYYGVKNGSVVHVHISNFPVTTNNSPTHETDVLNTNEQFFNENIRNFNTDQQNLHSLTNNIDSEVRFFTPSLHGVEEYFIIILQTGFRWLRRESENENISPNSRFYFLYTWYINFLDSILRYLEIWRIEIIRPRMHLSLGEHIRNNFSILIIFVILPPIIYLFNTSVTSLTVGSAFITCFVFCITFIILKYIYNFLITS